MNSFKEITEEKLDNDENLFLERIKNQNIDLELLKMGNENENFDYKKLYKEWLTDMNRGLARICKSASKDFSCISSLPKCLIRNTKKFCACDPDCVSELVNDTLNSTKCGSFDLNNLYDDTEYINCCGVMYLPKDRIMQQVIQGRDILNARINFYSSLYDTCEDIFNFSKLQCATTELRDQCLNDPECIIESLNDRFPVACKNEDFAKNLEEIRDFFIESMKIKDDFKDDEIFSGDKNYFDFTNHKSEEFLSWRFRNKREISDDNNNLNIVGDIKITDDYLSNYL